MALLARHLTHVAYFGFKQQRRPACWRGGTQHPGRLRAATGAFYRDHGATFQPIRWSTIGTAIRYWIRGWCRRVPNHKNADDERRYAPATWYSWKPPWNMPPLTLAQDILPKRNCATIRIPQCMAADAAGTAEAVYFCMAVDWSTIARFTVSRFQRAPGPTGFFRTYLNYSFLQEVRYIVA